MSGDAVYDRVKEMELEVTRTMRDFENSWKHPGSQVSSEDVGALKSRLCAILDTTIMDLDVIQSTTNHNGETQTEVPNRSAVTQTEMTGDVVPVRDLLQLIEMAEKSLTEQLEAAFAKHRESMIQEDAANGPRISEKETAVPPTSMEGDGSSSSGGSMAGDGSSSVGIGPQGGGTNDCQLPVSGEEVDSDKKGDSEQPAEQQPSSTTNPLLIPVPVVVAAPLRAVTPTITATTTPVTTATAPRLRRSTRAPKPNVRFDPSPQGS